MDEQQQKNVTKWLKALRSNDYEQGATLLRTPEDHFCCLGVACDLISQEPWKWDREMEDWYYDEEHELPKQSVMRNAYGVSHTDMLIPKSWLPEIDLEERGGLSTVTLDILNDNGVSFATIADVIERWYAENDNSN